MSIWVRVGFSSDILMANMSVLTRDELLKLAELARIRLTNEELDSLPAELSKIIEYVQQLDDVSVKDLEPTYQVTGLKNVTREDKIIDYQADAQQLMKNAPGVKGGQFKVKRVI